MKLNKPEMMKKAEVANKSVSGFWMQILCFFGVFCVISILQSIPQTVLMFKDIFALTEFSEAAMDDITSKYLKPTGSIALIMLFSTIFSIIVPIIYCRFIEKRPIFSMGIVKKRVMRNYLFGLIVGFIMFSAVILLNIWLGGMTFNGVNSNIIISYLLIYFIAFGIQGMSEEILCRGYLMNSIGGKHSIWLAIITSSLVFAILHLANPGVTILACINLTLFGIFAALYMICFDNIWGVCAIHSIWNFAQGLIYGISVSGAYSYENPVFLFETIQGKPFVNGGAFGAEGGIAVTIVLTLGILIVAGWMWHKKKIQFNKTEIKEK